MQHIDEENQKSKKFPPNSNLNLHVPVGRAQLSEVYGSVLSLSSLYELLPHQPTGASGAHCNSLRNMN